MNIIYIHGLDSDANSTKGQLLEGYCQQYHPDINVHRPDLNQPPTQVFERLIRVVLKLEKESKVIVVGSSLGGYFSTLISNHTGCSALLLNPSTQPHITLQRFADKINLESVISDNDLSDNVIYTTAGGWAITATDLRWFNEHQLHSICYPDKVAVFIKEGDELLNPHLAVDFYQRHGVTVTLQQGGDHRFSDFDEQLPMLIRTLQHQR